MHIAAPPNLPPFCFNTLINVTIILAPLAPKGCPKETLSNYDLHFNYLKSLPELINMTPITQPYVFPYSGLVPEDKGITGIVIIAESHISIHSFEEKGYSFIDIFSVYICLHHRDDYIIVAIKFII